MKINEVMKQFREFSGITLEQIAKETGTTRQYISAVELGKRSINEKIIKPYLDNGLTVFISCSYDMDDPDFLIKSMEDATGSNIKEILKYLKSLTFKKVY